jgi:hypothetical protein
MKRLRSPKRSGMEPMNYGTTVQPRRNSFLANSQIPVFQPFTKPFIGRLIEMNGKTIGRRAVGLEPQRKD